MAERPAGPERRGGRRPGPGPEELERARLPRPAAGDPDSLVAIESPDDVDLYRHDGPPPGFAPARTGSAKAGKPNTKAARPRH